MKTPRRGLVLANTTQIFPEDRGTNYAVREGDEAARALLEWLRSARRRPLPDRPALNISSV